MEKQRILVLDHQPDKEIFAQLEREKNLTATFAAGYLQAVTAALRTRPDAIYIRRDLPWLQNKIPNIFWENPIFADIRVVFYTPEELRGDWPSRNMHRPLPV